MKCKSRSYFKWIKWRQLNLLGFFRSLFIYSSFWRISVWHSHSGLWPNIHLKLGEFVFSYFSLCLSSMYYLPQMSTHRGQIEMSTSPVLHPLERLGKVIKSSVYLMTWLVAKCKVYWHDSWCSVCVCVCSHLTVTWFARPMVYENHLISCLSECDEV